jgi:hypothetical protein
LTRYLVTGAHHGFEPHPEGPEGEALRRRLEAAYIQHAQFLAIFQ